MISQRNEPLVKGLLATLMLPMSIVACSLLQPSSAPTIPDFVHHSPPNLRVETEWLQSGGCLLKEKWGTCAEDSPLREIGCEAVEVIDLLGGLPYPVVRCINYSVISPDSSKFRLSGCTLSEHFESYVMYKNGSYQLIGSRDEFLLEFAPIESENDALSYAMIYMGYNAVYSQQNDPYNHYLVDKIEDTYIEETEDGYFVHLFTDSEPLCGCGQHTVSEANIWIRRNGEFSRAKYQPVYWYEACCD